MIIGYTERNHNSNKQFLLHESDTLRYRKVLDVAALDRLLRNKLKVRLDLGVNQHYRGRQLYCPVQIIHLWNAVSNTNMPWVVTTSSGLPFGLSTDDSRYSLAVKSMASHQCRKIIYTSLFALEKTKRKVQEFENISSTICDKLLYLPPPQKPVLNPALKDFDQNVMEIAFVAKYLAGKGGCELINAFHRFIAGGGSARLSIVGSIPSIHLHKSTEYIERTERALNSCPHIECHGLLAHSEVLDVFKKCHISFLPSHRETYGYVVLESQSCACPVVTTNVGAFPEINNNDLGWQLDLSWKARPSSLNSPDQEYQESIMLEDMLLETLVRLEGSRNEIREKASRAYQNILNKHDLESHRETLMRIYANALA